MRARRGMSECGAIFAMFGVAMLFLIVLVMCLPAMIRANDSVASSKAGQNIVVESPAEVDGVKLVEPSQ